MVKLNLRVKQFSSTAESESNNETNKQTNQPKTQIPCTRQHSLTPAALGNLRPDCRHGAATAADWVMMAVMAVDVQTQHDGCAPPQLHFESAHCDDCACRQ